MFNLPVFIALTAIIKVCEGQLVPCSTLSDPSLFVIESEQKVILSCQQGSYVISPDGICGGSHQRQLRPYIRSYVQSQGDSDFEVYTWSTEVFSRFSIQDCFYITATSFKELDKNLTNVLPVFNQNPEDVTFFAATDQSEITKYDGKQLLFFQEGILRSSWTVAGMPKPAGIEFLYAMDGVLIAWSTGAYSVMYFIYEFHPVEPPVKIQELGYECYAAAIYSESGPYFEVATLSADGSDATIQILAISSAFSAGKTLTSRAFLLEGVTRNYILDHRDHGLYSIELSVLGPSRFGITLGGTFILISEDGSSKFASYETFSLPPGYEFRGKAQTSSGIVYRTAVKGDEAFVWSSDSTFGFDPSSTITMTTSEEVDKAGSKDQTQQTDGPLFIRKDAEEGGSSGLDPVIVSISIGGSLVACLLILFCCYWLRTTKRNNNKGSPDEESASIKEDDAFAAEGIPWEAFSEINSIAKGNFGTVFRARYNATQELVALKGDSRSCPSSFKKEMKLLCSFRQKDIIQFYGWSENGPLIYMVTEYCENGSLEGVIKMGNARSYLPKLVGIAMAVLYVHNRGMCHLDIASRNIVIDANNHLKLADMGLMKAIGEKLPRCLPVPWCPPEALQRDAKSRTEHDVWSFGCVICEVVTGKPPFSYVPGNGTVRLNAIRDLLTSGSFPLSNEGSDELTNTVNELFLKKCWKMNPEDRITLSEVVVLFQSSTFNIDQAALPSTDSSLDVNVDLILYPHYDNYAIHNNEGAIVECRDEP